MTLKKILSLSLLGLVVAGLLISVFFFFVINRDSTDELNNEIFLYEFNELYTNIKDSKNILKASITIEYNNESLLESLDKNKAKITNDILELLRNKNLEDLSGKSGQQTARNDILHLVKQIINSEDITNIYFTEFIFQ